MSLGPAGRGHRPRVRTLGLAIGAVLGLAVAACAGGHTGVDPTLFAAPTTTTVPAAAPGPAPAPVSCGDPKASSRPQGALPAPNQMPAGSFMDTIHARGRLVVGVAPDILLFGYVNPATGSIEGFDVDMLKQVAEAIFGGTDATIDAHIQYVTITNAQRIPKVRDSSVDIVADTMTINCARRQQVDFSSVYYDAGQRVLVGLGSSASAITDLGGKRVCAAALSTSLDNIAKAEPKAVTVAPPDQTDCLVAFQRGQVDAISTDDAVLAGLAKQDPFAHVVGPRFSDEPYGLAISLAHPEFTRFVNGVLERVRADGTWKAIYDHWLASLGPAPSPPAAVYRN